MNFNFKREEQFQQAQIQPMPKTNQAPLGSQSPVIQWQFPMNKMQAESPAQHIPNSNCIYGNVGGTVGGTGFAPMQTDMKNALGEMQQKANVGGVEKSNVDGMQKSGYSPAQMDMKNALGEMQQKPNVGGVQDKANVEGMQTPMGYAPAQMDMKNALGEMQQKSNVGGVQDEANIEGMQKPMGYSPAQMDMKNALGEMQQKANVGGAQQKANVEGMQKPMGYSPAQMDMKNALGEMQQKPNVGGVQQKANVEGMQHKANVEGMQKQKPYYGAQMPGGMAGVQQPQYGSQVSPMQQQTMQTPMPTGQALPPVDTMTPASVANPYFFAGYLRRFIGREMRVEFLIGTTGPLVDRIGTLLEVGASYIVLRLLRSDDILICDLFSIKFVNVYGGAGSARDLSTTY